MPYKVGITGGIGAGKSIICRIFAVLGVPVYDADARAKWLMNHDPALKEKLIALLGSNAYLPDKTLNRLYLAELVFSDPHVLQQINALVHPRVGEDFQSWHNKQVFPYVLKEAALLFESGSYKDLDTIITVTAPLELRITRVRERDPQRNRQQVLDIVHKQWPEEQKTDLSEFVIQNDEQALITPQIVALHNTFLERASKQ